MKNILKLNGITLVFSVLFLLFVSLSVQAINEVSTVTGFFDTPGGPGGAGGGSGGSYTPKDKGTATLEKDTPTANEATPEKVQPVAKTQTIPPKVAPPPQAPKQAVSSPTGNAVAPAPAPQAAPVTSEEPSASFMSPLLFLAGFVVILAVIYYAYATRRKKF